MAPLYLLDASIYVFQAHFSPYQQSFSTQGLDRSAFVGFSRFLLRLLERLKREALNPAIAVAFDESLFSGFRHRLYEPYKSNRVLPDDNLALQLKACQQLCAVLGAQAVVSEVYEADDIIGTLKQQAVDARQVNIITRDKDLAQLLVSDNDRLMDIQSGLSRSRHDIFAQFGIWPEQFPCYLGLAGDATDCIPGVPGVGPVTAKKLLSHFGNLDDLFDHVHEVSALDFRGAATCETKLRQYEQQARLSRTLASICTTADEEFAMLTPDTLRIGSIDHSAFSALLRDMQLDDYTYNNLMSQASL